jgi:3',5'-cyclic AMP phosphodiesterase CpdA
MAAEPVQVFLSYAPEDAAFAAELEAHLQGMVRQGEISVWSDRQMAAGADGSAERARHFEAAALLVLLVSPYFLDSELGATDLTRALHRQRTGPTRVAAILVRACNWEATPLEALLPMPHDQQPVESWSNRDDAWTEIVREVRSLLKFGSIPIEVPAPGAPPEIRRIEDIFLTVGQPDITYVEPAQFKTLRRCLRTMGKGLVVEGPSGVGKTTLVSRALDDLRAEPREWLYAQREADRRKLDERLAEDFLGHLVIDDFHRLDPAQQARVADAMKYISDRNTRDAKITVVGINPVGESLVTALRDLAGRFDVVRMGGQPDEKISELIRKGEDAANIRFRRRDEFIRDAGGSFFIAQQLCQEAALEAGVEETAPALTSVDVGFRDVVKKVVDDLEGRYFGDLRTFACHDERVPPRGASLALLWLLSRSAEGHVMLDDVHFRFTDPDVREALARLKSSYLSRCFDETPALRSLLYYNRNAGILSIEDPRLAFYLRHMSWSRFIERTGHQNARIDEAAMLVFSRRRPSDRPSDKERLVNLLHLSDLHFSQSPQADEWFGQLAEDLRELGCDRLDVLVLTGDLTQRAAPSEFDAARRFVLRLSTDARLSPGQVVVVPGNHDLDWSLSKAAYSFHRREDYAGPLEEGEIIAHGATVVEVRDEAAYKQRFKPFADFYAHIKGTAYPLDYEAQFDVQDFAKENLLIVGFNSSWETDHHFRSRAGIHAGALARALERLRQSDAWASRIKIAVWHHPLSSPGDDRIKDHGFMQQLAKAGFRLVLHGHVHKAERSLFRYDMGPDGRRLDVVAAGTFGAPSTEWVPGFPLQYNLLRISKDRVVVETRRREEPNGAWQPDARWLQGPGKDPLPRYEIALRADAP